MKSPLYIELVHSYHFGNRGPQIVFETPLYIELVHPYHFGNKVPQFVCKVYARAVIVSLGLGRPRMIYLTFISLKNIKVRYPLKQVSFIVS